LHFSSLILERIRAKIVDLRRAPSFQKGMKMLSSSQQNVEGYPRTSHHQADR
jgi:hypothetical protein